MYIIEIAKDTKAYDSWNEVPDVKLSSLVLLSPDKNSNIKLEGFAKYVCMKEALATVGGFKLMANICYAMFDDMSIKYRITNDNIEATLIKTNKVLNDIISTTLIRSGEERDFMI
jgi:hypothetical protein